MKQVQAQVQVQVQEVAKRIDNGEDLPQGPMAEQERRDPAERRDEGRRRRVLCGDWLGSAAWRGSVKRARQQRLESRSTGRFEGVSWMDFSEGGGTARPVHCLDCECVRRADVSPLCAWVWNRTRLVLS